MEIQAALVKVLEERILHLGNGEGTEKAHPNFQILGTCTTTATTANSLSGGGDAALFIMRLLDKSGREEEMAMRNINDNDGEVKKEGEKKREEHDEGRRRIQ
eukprot:8056419-Ditylum_brightwellii.AAC.1